MVDLKRKAVKMNERFNFRIAIKQADGTYKRYQTDVIGWVNDKLYAKCAIPKNDKEFLIEDIVIDGDNAILEQCTGMKDKNGNLIYEGNVLRFESQIDVCVTFRNGGFVYSLTEDEKLAYRFTEVIAKETQIIGKVNEKDEK